MAETNAPATGRRNRTLQTNGAASTVNSVAESSYDFSNRVFGGGGGKVISAQPLAAVAARLAEPTQNPNGNWYSIYQHPTKGAIFVNFSRKAASRVDETEQLTTKMELQIRMDEREGTYFLLIAMAGEDPKGATPTFGAALLAE